MYHKYVTWCRSVAPTNHRGGRSSVRFQWQCSSPGERCWLVRSYHDGFHGPCALLHQHLSEVVWWPVKSETPRILIIAKLSNRNSPWFTMIHPANSPWFTIFILIKWKNPWKIHGLRPVVANCGWSHPAPGLPRPGPRCQFPSPSRVRHRRHRRHGPCGPPLSCRP